MFSQGEGEVGCKNGFVHFEFLYFHFLWEDTTYFMGTVLAFRIFAGSQFMFSWQQGELKMDLYILSF
jgi:hypothetical protein